MSDKTMSTAEAGMPWITYHYGLTHDLWWPFWTSTRVLGRMRIKVACAVCGAEKVLSLRIPRFGAIPDRGHHPARRAWMREHAHPDRGHPMSWAKPLTNMNNFGSEGLPLDLLAMRLEADLNDPDTRAPGADQ